MLKNVEELTTKELIIAIRIGLKVNQLQLANILHTEQSNISRWQNGVVEPGLIEKDKLKKIYLKLPDDIKYREE